jgi:hypothetical protein
MKKNNPITVRLPRLDHPMGIGLGDTAPARRRHSTYLPRFNSSKNCIVAMVRGNSANELLYKFKRRKRFMWRNSMGNRVKWLLGTSRNWFCFVLFGFVQSAFTAKHSRQTSSLLVHTAHSREGHRSPKRTYLEIVQMNERLGESGQTTMARIQMNQLQHNTRYGSTTHNTVRNEGKHTAQHSTQRSTQELIT